MPTAAASRVNTSGNTVGNTMVYAHGVAKVMISLADDLLAAIDDEVRQRGTSRSALLAAAARRELARRDSAAVQAAILRSEERFAGAGAFEAAELVRQDRDARR